MTIARCIGTVVVATVACTGQERRAEITSLLAAGESLSARGSYDTAQAAFTRVLTLPGVRGTADEARALTDLGLVAYRRADYPTARRLGDSALALKERYGLPARDRAESRIALGLLAWDQGRLSDATSFFTRALAEYDTAGDRAGTAKALNNLALVAVEDGRFAEAREQFTRVRAAGRELRNARIEGRATTNLAMLEVTVGDPRAAIPLVAQARALARTANDPVNEENALSQLALGLAAMGNPGQALATVDSAIAITRRHGLRQEEAEDLALAAVLYASAGDLDRALQHYATARAVYDTLDLPVDAATVERHESLIRATRGATAQARLGVERALARHREHDAVFESFQDLLALARIETDAGAVDAAGRWLADADRAGASLESPQVRVAVGLARARWFDAQRAAASSLAAIRAVEDDLDVADAQTMLEADWLRVRAYATLGQLDSAVAAARRSAAAIERVGDALSSLTLRVGYRAERHRIVADIVLTLLRAGAPADAFRIAESARGQALRGDLLRARGDVEGARLAPNAAALAERERLLREIDALVARLAEIEQRPRSERGAEWPRQSTELARRIREARSAYEALVLRQIEDASDPGRRRMLGAPSVDAATVRGVVRPGEAVIEYYATRDTLIIFALTRERLTPVVVPVRLSELETRVRLARGLLAVPGRGEASGVVLERLFATLIQPLRRAGVLDGVTTLILVPHGVLTYLPFPALRDATTGRVLAEDFTLARLPAAGMLALLRESDAPRDAGSTAILAPFPERLPATGTEAEALTRIMPNAVIYRGTAATEDRLRRTLDGPAPVHVATHAAFNSANPMFSGLALAAGRGGSRDDGRLELHEVLEIPVRSPLVFLSGCETAVGAARATAFDRMEDVTTLGDAFLLSGAGAVIATLWRINDEGAAYFAEAFYRKRATHPAAEALVEAQRELIRHARWGDPYYWAAYTLSGDASVVKRK